MQDKDKKTVTKTITKNNSNTNELGNTSANLANGGLIVGEKDCLYFGNAGKLYKKEGDSIKELCKIDGRSRISNVNVLNGWIYFYASGEKGTGIYKIKTDGSKFQRILSDSSQWRSLWGMGESLYYDYNYKIDKNGSNKKQIGEKRTPISYSFNISDGYMYYCEENMEGDHCIYKEKIDGTDKTEIYDERADYMIVDNGWIYFLTGYGSALNKMKIDGTDYKKLIVTSIGNMNIKDDWIYYESSDGIYKIKTDGTENQKLYAYTSEQYSSLGGLCIVGDWLYYADENYEDNTKDKIFRAKTDGSKKEVFFSLDEQETVGKNDKETNTVENKEQNIELNNTYRTKFEEVNMVTYPAFEFDYPSTWNVTEDDTQGQEIVTISNERGVTVTYSHLEAPVGQGVSGGSGVYMSRVEATKADDSNFIPGYVQATDYSGLGKFVVAKLKQTGEMDMKNDSDFKDIDGKTAYAVMPESQLGVFDSVRNAYCIEFGFEYAGGLSFIAEAPEDGFTKQEEKAVIKILKSFRVVE